MTQNSKMKLVIDKKTSRTMKFTTRGIDTLAKEALTEFDHHLGQPCNGWDRQVNVSSLQETTPWWWWWLWWLSFGLFPNLQEWEVEYRAVYSRWE